MSVEHVFVEKNQYQRLLSNFEDMKKKLVELESLKNYQNSPKKSLIHGDASKVNEMNSDNKSGTDSDDAFEVDEMSEKSWFSPKKELENSNLIKKTISKSEIHSKLFPGSHKEKIGKKNLNTTVSKARQRKKSLTQRKSHNSKGKSIQSSKLHAMAKDWLKLS